jgi:hypothetical protein
VHIYDPISRTFTLSASAAGPIHFIARDHSVTAKTDENGITTFTVWRVSLRVEHVPWYAYP